MLCDENNLLEKNLRKAEVHLAYYCCSLITPSLKTFSFGFFFVLFWYYNKRVHCMRHNNKEVAGFFMDIVLLN